MKRDKPFRFDEADDVQARELCGAPPCDGDEEGPCGACPVEGTGAHFTESELSNLVRQNFEDGMRTALRAAIREHINESVSTRYLEDLLSDLNRVRELGGEG